MNIAFFGGSFDPPHIGHWEIARYCEYRFDKFIIFPARQSPLKDNSPIVSQSKRLAMLEIFQTHFSSVEIDEFELHRDPPSYTIHTIKYLKEKYPEAGLNLIIGYDHLVNFNLWHRWKEILKNVKILCFQRTVDDKVPAIDIQYELISDFNFPISSTQIRQKIGVNPQSAKEWLHPAVFQYIIDHDLYRNINDCFSGNS